tara:strand:+ start:248 stop:469 length:222 start_codon:yes stop_codon:yes gene_type:complete
MLRKARTSASVLGRAMLLWDFVSICLKQCFVNHASMFLSLRSASAAIVDDKLTFDQRFRTAIVMATVLFIPPD